MRISNRLAAPVGLVSVLTLGLVACSSTPDPPSADDGREHLSQPGSESFGLDLAMTAEPTVIPFEGTIHITLTVTNDTDEPITHGFSSGCVYGFGLYDGNDRLVAPPPPICTMNAPVITYEPGEVVMGNFEWTWDDPGLKPGTYTLRAGFGPRGEFESAAPITIHLE